MGLRNILLKDYREEVISKAIFEEIQKLENIKKKKLIRIIDYGSGFNPAVIKKLIKKLSTKYKNVNFQANCYDYYNRSQINLMNKQKVILGENLRSAEIEIAAENNNISNRI